MASKKVTQTKSAHKILKYTIEAKKSLLEACDESRTSRRTTGGRTTHAEQDLLRAMLAFSGAGLDSLLKRLIKDSLRDLALMDAKVQNALETFTLRRLQGKSGEDNVRVGNRFLANILASSKPHNKVIEDYTFELTSTSLQSVDQLFEVAAALGIETNKLGLDKNKIKEIFEARNQIIHELDIQLGHGKGRRFRSRDSMVEFSDILIEIGRKFVTCVEEKMRTAEP